MPHMEFSCRPTVIGSMPHTDAAEACSSVTHYLKDIPVWPQLPNRSFLENMCVQFSEGFPGVVLGQNSIHVDHSPNQEQPLEQLYAAYLENNVEKYSIGPGRPSSPSDCALGQSLLPENHLPPLQTCAGGCRKSQQPPGEQHRRNSRDQKFHRRGFRVTTCQSGFRGIPAG